MRSPASPILQGRPWTQADVFGITPDPTVVATLGVLLTADARARWALLVVPLAWSAVGGMFLWTMDDANFVVLVGAGGLAAVAAMTRARGRRA